MSGNSFGFPSVATSGSDEVEHRRRLAQAINILNQGKMNAVTTLTLNANATTTTLTDARITQNSFLGFMPITANAAAALSGLFVASRMAANGTANGTATLTHTNNAQTDKTFTVLIIG